ncbi:MAG: DUF2203 family protein [Gemmataceae bacterium]
MSGFTENRTPNASDFAGAPARLLTWQAAKAMLPLVGRIADDLLTVTKRLEARRIERACLDDESRRGLSWPQRRRRYLLDEEIEYALNELRQLYQELDLLGVEVLLPENGLVGFPTLVNQRRAYFSWKPGETDLLFWQYAGDLTRREVPADWIANPPRKMASSTPGQRNRQR